MLSGLIGSVTFFGSLVAFAKLRELKIVKDVRFAGQHFMNAILLLARSRSAARCPIVSDPTGRGWLWYWAVVGFAAVLGLLVVLPIGGADMPVVICLLNSYSGIAASMPPASPWATTASSSRARWSAPRG